MEKYLLFTAQMTSVLKIQQWVNKNTWSAGRYRENIGSWNLNTFVWYILLYRDTEFSRQTAGKKEVLRQNCKNDEDWWYFYLIVT